MDVSSAVEKIDKLLAFVETYPLNKNVVKSGAAPELRIPYATPMEAFTKGEREKVMFVTATRTDASTCSHQTKGKSDSSISDVNKADFIAVVNVDPTSDKYCQIINELPLGNNVELHHFGWNSCAGCLCNNKNEIKKRRFLIAPAFSTGDVFIIDTNDINNIKLHKKIPAKYLRENFGVSWPHTSHCLADGTVMMSFLGFDGKKAAAASGKDDEKNGNNNKDSYCTDNQWLLFDGKDESFKCLGKWIRNDNKNGNNNNNNNNNNKKKRYSYDFWYQPYHNIMISSEWGHPNAFSNGFNPNDVSNGLYGHSIHLWDWEKHELIKTIEFKPNQVVMALETRFLHNPRASHAFINGALSSNIIHIFLNEKKKEWDTNASYIQVNGVDMENWILPTMPGLITDILISMDDKYLYFANWLHGDVRQYNISDPYNPKLTGQAFVGGLLRKDNGFGYKVDLKSEKQQNFEIPKVAKLMNGKVFIEGGPQMLQLSLDGKRLYVTNSLFSPFDKQFYPNLIEKGGMILMCDVDHENGGLTLNTQFCVDFGKNTKSGVPARPHEMRYPGGDCTSDIFIDLDEKDSCCCSD